MDIRIPEVGESIQEALLAKWFKKNGESVHKDDPLCEIETDKITLDVNADVAGILSIQVEEGATVKIGTVIGVIAEQTVAVQALPALTAVSEVPLSHEGEIKAMVSSPSIRREMREQGVAPDSVSGTGKGGRITLDDLFSRIEEKARRIPEVTPEDGRSALPPNVSVSSALPASPSLSRPTATDQAVTVPVLSVRSEEAPSYDARREERKAMSPIRKRIAERLLAVRQQTAMLTTFN